MQNERRNTLEQLTRVLFLAGFFFFAHLLTAKPSVERHTKEMLREQAAEQVFNAQAILVQGQQQVSAPPAFVEPLPFVVAKALSLPVNTDKASFLHHPRSVPDGFIRFFHCYHRPYGDDPDHR